MTTPVPRKCLVVTSDDFGLSPQVNAAVEQAHRHGILTAASLMVSAPGAADALALARAMPSLRVGLHLVMVEAWPTLPAAQLPDLTDGAGLMRADQARLGSISPSSPAPAASSRPRSEPSSRPSGRPGCPSTTSTRTSTSTSTRSSPAWCCGSGRDYGMRAIRVPREPRDTLRRAEPGARPSLALDNRAVVGAAARPGPACRAPGPGPRARPRLVGGDDARPGPGPAGPVAERADRALPAPRHRGRLSRRGTWLRLCAGTRRPGGAREPGGAGGLRRRHRRASRISLAERRPGRLPRGGAGHAARSPGAPCMRRVTIPNRALRRVGTACLVLALVAPARAAEITL